MEIVETTWMQQGIEYEAIAVSWDDITDYLGFEHHGNDTDDNAVIAGLLEAGAPDWIKDNSGGSDDKYWYVVNYDNPLT